jgi:hypothetical protein
MLTRASFSPMVRRRWAARARELAMERFDWSAVAANFEGLMRTALTRAAEAQQAKAPTSSY